jgi:hypothetical protein
MILVQSWSFEHFYDIRIFYFLKLLFTKKIKINDNMLVQKFELK